MILGQSAATISAIANEQSISVQDVTYDDVSKRLLADGQILQAETSKKAKKEL